MSVFAIPVLKGTAVAVIVAAPLWWLPIFLQRVIPDSWLLAMMVPSVMLGGYVAARGALRPLSNGVISGVVSMLIISSFTLSAGELWVIPAIIFLGGASAVVGAYVAIRIGHAGVRK